MEQFYHVMLYLSFMVTSKGAEFHTWNVALGKPAVQSSVTLGGTADRAVDGNWNNNFFRGSCIHTLHGEVDQWWMVDLQGVYNITDVWIQNRGDEHGHKFHDFVVEVHSSNPVVCEGKEKVVCNSHPGGAGLGENVHMPCLTVAVGRYVRILKLPEHITDPNEDVLIICEVQVNGTQLQHCPIDVKYTKKEGQKINTDNPITSGMSRLGCSKMCENSCYGINYHYATGGCQVFTELLSKPSLTVDSDWDFYTRC